jgi:hypothetical protein
MKAFLGFFIYVSCLHYLIHISASIPYLPLPHNLVAEDRILNPRKTQLSLGGGILESVNCMAFSKQDKSVLAYAVKNLHIDAYDG